jgi:outer membrane receptor protein involved in Fe transport
MRRRLFCTIAAGVLFGSASARADEGIDKLGGLLEEEVVTTASRSAEQAADAPALSRTMTSEEIRRFGIRSLDEALDFLGVGIRSAKSSGAPGVGVRGVLRSQDQGNHVLLLLDGHILNEPFYGSAQFGQGLGVPLELIDHIEVVLGPGSVMYGSNAVFGVVNVVTKSASTHAGTHVAAEVSSHAGTAVTVPSSTRATATGGYTFDLFGKKTALTVGVSYFRQEGLPFDLPPQNLGIDPTDGLPFRYSRTAPATGIWGGRYRYMFQQEVPAAHVHLVRGQLEVMARAVQTSINDPSNAGGNFDEPLLAYDRRASLSIRQGLSLGHIADTSVRVFGDVFGWENHFIASRRSACWFAPPGTTCDNRTLTASRRVGVELQTNLNWSDDRRLTTLVTASASLNNIEGQFEQHDADTGAFLNPITTLAKPQTRMILAASAEQAWRPLDWLGFTAGARVDRDERFPAVLSPRLAVATHPWEGGTLKGVYAKAFRAPSFFETEGQLPILIHATKLQPERMDSKEIIFEQRIDRHRVALSVFDTYFTGLVDRVLLTPGEAAAAVNAGLTPVPYTPQIYLQQFRNNASVRSRGFTSAADAVALDGRLRVGGSFTGTIAQQSGDRLVVVAPRVFGNARVSYELGERLPTVALAATFGGKTVADKSYEGNFQPLVVAPPQLELRAALSGVAPIVRGLSYRLIGNYAFHSVVPYAIGPTNRSAPPITQPVLAPSRRFELTLGLQYDF